jgi:hypothetical protein
MEKRDTRRIPVEKSFESRLNAIERAVQEV